MKHVSMESGLEDRNNEDVKFMDYNDGRLSQWSPA